MATFRAVLRVSRCAVLVILCARNEGIFRLVYPNAFPLHFSPQRERKRRKRDRDSKQKRDDDDDDGKRISRGENRRPEPFLLGPNLKPARGAHHRDILAVVRTEIFPARRPELLRRFRDHREPRGV